MNQKRTIILSTDLKESYYDIYPLTSRSFPITIDYYNPLALLMDAYNNMVYRFHAFDGTNIDKEHLIRYTVHGIYTIRNKDGEENKLAVVVSAIPCCLMDSSAIYAVPTPGTEAEQTTLYKNLAIWLANTIHLDTTTDSKYIYKADLYYESNTVNIIEKAYRRELHTLSAMDAQFMGVVMNVLLNGMLIAITPDVVENVSPVYIQQWVDVLRHNPYSNGGILLPHLLYKDVVLQYLKKRYVLDNSVLEDIDQHQRYYLQSCGSEVEIPYEVSRHISYNTEALISFLSKNNILPSIQLKDAFFKHQQKATLFQYPMFNALRFVKDKNIKVHRLLSSVLDIYHPELPPLTSPPYEWKLKERSNLMGSMDKLTYYYPPFPIQYSAPTIRSSYPNTLQ